VDSSSWITILREAADGICSAIAEARPRGMGLETRDYKHILDEAAQNALVDSLSSRGVSAQLISEEGNVLVGGGGPTVIADPVDGTTNLARDLRPAVTCLSVSENCFHSGTLAAVVKDIYTGDTYAAEPGKGATLNGCPIRIAAPRQARSALVSMGISKTPKLDRVAPLLNACRYIRMFGSSASELTLIASGGFDAHVDVRGTVRATDVAAALTILSEAGGVYAVDGAIGGDFTLTKETTMELVAASNRPLLDELLALTKCP
jgi:fructose-1,6-bisphosphatase/inositol monophosphatase family enzyme